MVRNQVASGLSKNQQTGVPAVNAVTAPIASGLIDVPEAAVTVSAVWVCVLSMQNS
jgi:hypothetical protein